MKCSKAAGPSGSIAEMLKAAGDHGLEFLRQLPEEIFSNGEIPRVWEESYILNLYKGRGEALDHGDYRGIKLTNQTMKLLEYVLGSHIHVHKLLPIVAFKHVFLATCGKVSVACVRSALLHSSETWAPTASDLQQLCRNNRAMVCWICGIRPREVAPAVSLYARLGVQEVTQVVCTRRLRWYGHATRASAGISSIMNLSMSCSRGRGRPRKTWLDCNKSDISDCSLNGVDPWNRDQ